VALFISLVAGLPANAQFWGGWGNWGGWGGQPQPQPQQRAPRPFNHFGTFFRSPHPPIARERQEPADYASAPTPQKKPDPSAANRIMVVGDGMADWLAYGLEDTFAENPEFAILRRHRTTSGLIRYDPRRDVEWPQVIKELIAADKPKFIVMMIGINDRQPIRERAAAPAPGNVPGRAPALAKPPRPEPSPADLELQAQQSAEQQNAERGEDAESPPASSAEQRGARGNVGPFEFQDEKWEAAYLKRIDVTIAALKSAGVPVFWVSLPAQRNTRASADSAYLNDLYRQEAEKGHISYVDIWGGFVNEEGQYSPQGPDFEGQIRRLRSGDGVYFTKFGARKLAHYVERVALPLEPQAAPKSDPAGSIGSRPFAGPVVPLTVSTGAGDELLGSARGQPPSGADPLLARVLTRGEAIAPQSGRADDFSWPRSSEAAPAPSADASQSPLLPAAKVSAGGSAKGQIQLGAGAVPSGDPASDQQRNGLDATIGSSSDSRQTVGSSVRHSINRRR